ncbi:hypothetical protein AXG93_1406s1260 [Marchantia polymorpha subsp. ruderalis]|uniref:Mitochondrial fission 1 protein n=1 Tax=Marchantia polymorpha subsp. ruderalis TaxID=1480154 RepID=A0A176W0D6_MARPO|nr:hypothetical protein AXG93_1406s1260 [Marchantia polymorpha subsp. ruderalis]
MPGWIDAIISKFSSGDSLPWTDAQVIQIYLGILGLLGVDVDKSRGSGWAFSFSESWSSMEMLKRSWFRHYCKIEHAVLSYDQDLEREAAQEGQGKNKSESIMRLAWALVHSAQPADVQRASLGGQGGPLQKWEILYLLAVGHYRTGDLGRCRRLVDQALEIAPDFRQAVALRKMVEDKIAQEGAIGVGIAAAAVGIVASGVAALLIRKK